MGFTHATVNHPGLTDYDKKARHLELMIQLKLAGTSFSEIARELNLTHSAVLAISTRRQRSRRIETAIADKLGVSPAALWPEWYLEADGEAS